MNNYRLLKFGFLLGKSVEDEKIQEHLKRLGYTWRLSFSDEKYYAGTSDFDLYRLDIGLKHNKIVEF